MTDVTFWDRIAPKYANSPISDPDAYAQTLARVGTYLKDTDRVLELGCGTGTTALKLAGQVAHYTATDISPGMIAIAKEKQAKNPTEGLEFQVAGLKHSELAAQSPDKILAFNLFHLVPDLEQVLAKLHAALPTGGLFISKTPALAKRWYFRPIIRVMQLVGKAPYVRMLGVDEIDTMIKAAGFRIVETGLYPPKTPSRFIVAEKV